MMFFEWRSQDDNVSSSVGSTIQASEETMQLTNSYLNAIRQDVSVKRNLLESIGNNLLPTISITAQAQLQQLNMIAENTRRNADAARRIEESLSSEGTANRKYLPGWNVRQERFFWGSNSPAF